MSVRICHYAGLATCTQYPTWINYWKLRNNNVDAVLAQRWHNSSQTWFLCEECAKRSEKTYPPNPKFNRYEPLVTFEVGSELHCALDCAFHTLANLKQKDPK